MVIRCEHCFCSSFGSAHLLGYTRPALIGAYRYPLRILHISTSNKESRLWNTCNRPVDCL